MIVDGGGDACAKDSGLQEYPSPVLSDLPSPFGLHGQEYQMAIVHSFEVERPVRY